MTVGVVLLLLCLCGGAACAAGRSGGEFSIVGYSEEDLASHDRLIRAVQEVQEGVRELRGEGEKVYFEVFNDNLKSSITLTR